MAGSGQGIVGSRAYLACLVVEDTRSLVPAGRIESDVAEGILAVRMDSEDIASGLELDILQIRWLEGIRIHLLERHMDSEVGSASELLDSCILDRLGRCLS